jgi:hypothetical protein
MEGELLLKINEITDEKQSISARVNKYVYEEYKKNEIPISSVIETSLIYFLKLDGDEKIKFLSENLPECVDKEDIKQMNLKWKDFLLDLLKKINIPLAIAITIVAGPIIGPICIIAGCLFKESKDNNGKVDL